MSDYFYVSNGVRQGGILSPKLYSVYVDDLSDYLVKSQIGCQIDNVCVNHVMYADDICLMAPSPAALQKLINICYDFSLQNNLTFNFSKSFCMIFKPRLHKLLCPTFYINNEKLDYTDSIKYLGFTFSSDKKDDNDTSTMSIASHLNYLQGVVPALCMQLITLIVLKFMLENV